MTDIVDRLRRLSPCGEPLLLHDDAIISQAAAEIERLRLTDAEREAVAVMERVANRTEAIVVGIGPRHARRLDGDSIAATLRGLLERTQEGDV